MIDNGFHTIKSILNVLRYIEQEMFNTVFILLSLF